MKLINKSSESIVLEFSKEELVLVCNALNEVCHGIDIPEFETRLGGTEENALTLLKQISKEL